MPEGAAAVVEYLRHDDHRAALKRGESSKLAGMFIASTGAGIIVFGFWAHDYSPLLVGLIPLMFGTSLLVHAYGIRCGAGNQSKADSGLNNE
jgi:Flp pilus assembly protein TadB